MKKIGFFLILMLLSKAMGIKAISPWIRRSLIIAVMGQVHKIINTMGLAALSLPTPGKQK